MRLTVLGCSGSVPGPNSPSSGYLVEAGGQRLCVDLGNGTLAVLQTVCDPFAVDALLFSHLHPDHCADFTALTVLRRYHPKPPVDVRRHRLPVHAASEAPSRFAAAYAADAAELAETDLSDVFDFHALGGGTVDIAGFRVTAAPVDHPCEAFAFRIERDGRSLVYTGDTALCPPLVDLARGADTLLSEASWTDDPSRPPHLHMSGREAGSLAASAGVGRLILTHITPWADADTVEAEARSAFEGDLARATPGAVYEI